MSIILCLAFLFTGCASKDNNKGASDLPEKMPADVVITYSENGGMLNVSEQIYISKDSCFYEKQRYGNAARVNFDMDEEEMKRVYDFLLENNFDEIETYSEKVYDRGGSFITVRFGDNYVTKSNSGVNFISEKWKEEYSAVAGMLNRIAEEKWLNSSRDFIVIIDGSVTDDEGYIIFDDEKIFGNDEDGTIKRNEKGEIVNVLKLVEGSYNLNYNYLNDYGAKEIKINGHKGIRIYMNNGKLSWKYF